MSRVKVPGYLFHKRSGHARCYINGVEHHLGPHGSAESKAKYDQLIAEYLAGRQIASGNVTVTNLCLAYWEFAKKRYTSGKGKHGGAINWRPILELLRDFYGELPGRQFGPKKFRQLFPAMIAKGWSRSHLNENIGRVKRIFKWGEAEELIPHEVYAALTAVEGIRPGNDVRETEPVGPVDDAIVDTTIKKLRRVPADMVRVQRLSGCRPGEVCPAVCQHILHFLARVVATKVHAVSHDTLCRRVQMAVCAE